VTASLPEPTPSAEERAARRVAEAAEEFYAAGKAYGLDVDRIRELEASFAVRSDAWCHRVDRLLEQPLGLAS
jgi:hypothetical protein